MKARSILLALFVLAAAAPCAKLHAAEPLLTDAKLAGYVARFNADDREVFHQAFANANALEFLSANVPRFECPDEDIERAYYFRWWTFRKHLQQTPEGWVITEFLPKVSWSGKCNTINCAAGHHFREARWLADRAFARDYFLWWMERGGNPRAYSAWMADSVLAWCDVTGDFEPARQWLPCLLRNYAAWEQSRLDSVSGLFWQNDGADGMEGSISGGGFRPTINSYMFGDALAIARIAQMSGKNDLAREFQAKAEKLKQLVQSQLWNEQQQFFEVRHMPRALGFYRCWLNGDAALTASAKPSASAKGDVKNLQLATTPADSYKWAQPHFHFDNRLGAREWVQYDLPAPAEISSVWLYLMTGGNFAPPESVNVFYRDAGQWQPVSQAKSDPFRINRFNKITFAPIRADAIKIEVTMQGSDRSKLDLANVRELLGYVPWYFNLPDERFAVAWKQLTDPRGFASTWGLTTAEQRHPQFAIQYDRHECLWNGPVWPFATAQTLTALANHLNRDPHPSLSHRDFLDALRTYARSHQLKRDDGKTVSWIDEDQDPFTGDWIARRCILNWEKADPRKWQSKGGTSDRGKDYNHSTFCDLVINGLVGLRPRADDVIEVNPLVPADTWEWFCLDRIPYHGKMLTILWDKTGAHYGKGAGLRVFADGKQIAAAATLTRLAASAQPEGASPAPPRPAASEPAKPLPDPLTPPAPATPRINGPTVFGVRPGSPFLFTIPASGQRPMTFAVEGLPDGLSLDPATGQITGRLSKEGTYPVTLAARNAMGDAKRVFKIVVGDNIALTPPMGWSSWNCWASAVTQEKVLRAANAMVASGLSQHGWTYINIDDSWQGARGGSFNAIQPNAKFPDIKALADAVHRLGLKFGIYSTPWRGSYAGFVGSSCDRPDGVYDWIAAGRHDENMRLTSPDPKQLGPIRKANWKYGAVSFAEQDARQWAQWGVDFLKYDWWPIDVPHTDAMRQALRSSGRDIVYSLSNGAPFNEAAEWARLANMWRTTGDMIDTWKSMSRGGFVQDKWQPFQSPGHYNDPDMLVIGQLGWGRPRPNRLTPDEQYLHMSLWCLLSAPLVLGCDLEKLDPFTLGLLTNDEVLAIDQDPLVKPAVCITPPGDLKVYVKELVDGAKAIGLFNTADSTASVTLKWEDAGLKGPQRLRDLWRQQNIGVHHDNYSAAIPSHGVVLLKATPAS